MSNEVAELDRRPAEFPDGWRASTVGETADILDKLRVPLNSEQRRQRQGIYPYWGANGVVDYIDDFIFDEPLVLMAEDGGYFDEAASRPICHRLDGPAWVNNHAHIIRPTSADRDYFYYWFVHRDITPFIKGGTRSKLNQADLKRLPIWLPPLDEQRRIGEVLRSVDEAIAAADVVVSQASEAFEGLLADLFSRYGDASAKLENYCVEGGLQTGPFGSQLKAEDYVEQGVPVIMPVDLMSEGIDFKHAKKAPTAKSRELARHILQPGDVLFARRGEIGRCGLYLDGDPVALCGTGCLRARLDTDKIDPALAYFLIQSRQAREWLCAHAVGVTMPNLNTTIIGELPMPDIPKDEQGAWVDALLMIEGTRRINQRTLTFCQRTKSSLMSDLLSGRVRVPAPVVTATRSVPSAFKRAVFAAEIVHQLHNDNRFGSVKHEKIVHLCELHLGLQDDLDRHAYKEAAGPYDPKARRSVERFFQQQKWFDATKPDGNRVVYVPLEKAGGHAEYFDRYFGDQKPAIQSVIDLLRPLNTEQCEIVATLYAVWNDFLIDKRQPTDDEIVASVLQWHPKKQLIAEDRWLAALPWMRQKGLIPKGTGEKTRVAQG